MLNDITLGQYFPGKSPIHLLDPRTKILAVVAYISTIFLAEDYLAYGILIAFAALAVGVSQIPFRMVLKSIKPLWIIIILTLAIHVFSTPGSVIFSLGPLTATQEGARTGILMSIRLVLLIAVSSLLTFTTSPIALTDGIEAVA